MTRTATRHGGSLDLGEGRFQGERALVEGRADDGAFHAERDERRDGPQVGQAGHSPAGHHGRGGAGADVPEQVQVGAAQRAVLEHVGHHVPGAALGVQPVQRLVQLAALGGPAAGGQPGAPDVQPDRDPLPVPGDDRPHPVRVLQRRGADVDPGAAGAERAGQRVVVPDAAGHLHLHVQAAHHVREQVRVGAAAEGGVQVHQVDPRGAGPLPGQRGLHRVAVLAAAAGHALDELDRVPVGDVDGGQQGEPGHSVPSQLASSAAPASPDFSGWNWVADSTPCSAAAANRSPCSVQEMRAPAAASLPRRAARSA